MKCKSTAMLLVASYTILVCVMGYVISASAAHESAIIQKVQDAFNASDNSYVIIDPGHGGMDGGAVGIHNILEKDINLAVSLKLRNLMNLFGVSTDMTRSEDISLHSDSETVITKKVQDMRKRLELINSKPYDALLSIHMNDYPKEKYWGSQVFYSRNNEKSSILAQIIQNSLRQIVAPDNKREAKMAPSDIYLMKNAKCPALIVECGFLSNEKEERLLQNDLYQLKLALAVSYAFINYSDCTK